MLLYVSRVARITARPTFAHEEDDVVSSDLLAPRQPLTLTATQVRRQWFALLELVAAHQTCVLIVHHRMLRAALVPIALAQGRGVVISKRGKPIASLIKARFEGDPR